MNQLSDFLLAVTSDTENKNIKLSGTSGYLAPEYLSDGMENFIRCLNCILISIRLNDLRVCCICLPLRALLSVKPFEFLFLHSNAPCSHKHSVFMFCLKRTSFSFFLVIALRVHLFAANRHHDLSSV